MDFDVPIDVIRGIKRILPIEYKLYVRNTFFHRPEVYASFLHIMDEHRQHRINIPDVLMRISELFDGHEDLIAGFCSYLPHSVYIKDDVEDESMETLRPVKKAKIEDGSAKPISEFAATSSASASYSSSFPENAAEPRAPKEKDGLRNVFSICCKSWPSLLDRSEAYYSFITLVKRLNIRRYRRLDIMENAANAFQGYPELIEGFNRYLPVGFRLDIV